MPVRTRIPGGRAKMPSSVVLRAILADRRQATMPGVEAFRADVYEQANPDGTTEEFEFTPADIRRIVENFYRFSVGRNCKFPVPIVLDHTDSQRVLQDLGLPAGGYVTRAWQQTDQRHGDLLKLNFGGMPAVVAAMSDRGLFRRVSVEIIDNYVDENGREWGPVLKRVAMLGSLVPKVKGLKDLPKTKLMTFTQARGRQRVLRVFSEVRPVKRDQMLAILKKKMPTLSEGTLKAMSDDALASMVSDCVMSDTGTGGGSGGGAGMGDGGGDYTDPATMTRDELIAELVAMGENAADLANMTDDELRQRYTELSSANFDDDAADLEAADEGADPDKKKPAGVVRRPVKPAAAKLTAADAAISRRLDRIERNNNAALAMTRRNLAEQQKGTAKTLCDNWVNQGYITPAEADPASKTPNIYLRLMAANPLRVRKFGDVQTNEFEAIRMEVESRGAGYVRKMFGDKIPTPAGGGEDPDVKSAKEHAARRNKQMSGAA